MEETKDVGNAKTDTAGSQEENGKKEVVAWESHDKLMKQHKRAQSELNEIKAKYGEISEKLTEIENERQSKAEEKLLKSGEQSKIIELREQKISELEEKMNSIASERDTLQNQMTTSDKLYAFYEKLPGKLKKNAYLKHVPLDEIVLDPENGQVDPQSVDTVVNKFMELYPETVDTKSGKRLPGDAAMANNPILPSNFKNLSLKDMKANIKQAVQTARTQRGV